MMNRLPPSEIYRGLSFYLKGISWLLQHPLYLFFLFLPMALCFMLFFVLGFTLWSFINEWLLSLFPFLVGEVPWWHLLWIYPLKGIFYLSCYVILVLFCFLLTMLLSAPVLESVSQRVESEVRGRLEQASFSFSASIFALKEEAKKLCFIAFVSIALLLIPGVNILGIFLSAFLLGWDFYDYPLARRNYSFSKRLKMGLKDFWAVFGLGLWQLIPFVQFFLMPLTVVGGTLLSLERIEKEEHNS